MAATALVGRNPEVGALRTAITTAAGGHGQVVLIEGEPGIGKTRLVLTACESARSAGFEVFQESCDDLVAGRPFAPLIAALTSSQDASEADRAAIAAVAELSDVEEATPLSDVSNPGLHYRITEALGALVERLAERGPLLLAIDDLQWADISTLVAMRSIARRVTTLPVMLLGTYRAGHDVMELHRVTDDLLRAGGARLRLRPLDHASVASLVAEVLDARPNEALLARVQGASGNPLFVIEYAQSVAASGDDEGSDAALEFRLTVLRRLATLSDETSDALRLAAVLGSTFSPGDLAVVSRRAVTELMPALHQAVVTGILEERGEHLAFRHALVRDAIYEHIPSAIRRQLHREVGQSLADAGSDALGVAHHLSLGAAAEDPDAVEWLRKAAHEAVARSPSTAVELLRRARELVGPSSPIRDALLAELAVALAWSGQLADAEALSIEVLDRRPDPDVAGPLRCSLVYALTWQGRPAEALRHTVLGPDDRISEWDAALLLAEAAVASLFAFDFRTAASQADEARERAERLGHEVALCHALTVQTWVALFAGRPAEAAELGLRAVDVADRSTSGEANLAHPRFFVAQPLHGIGRIDEAEKMLRSGLELAERLGLAWSLPLYHSRLGALAFIRGDWDSAAAECEAAIAVAEDVGLHVGAVGVSSAWLAAIQLHRDELEAAERTLADAMARQAGTGPQLGAGVLNWARALVLEAHHQYDEALALLQAAWELYQAGGQMTDPWSTMAHLRLRVATGDLERAAGLVAAIADQSAAVPQFQSGVELRARGLVEQDPDTLIQAVALYRQEHRNLDLAEACEEAALLLASADRLDEAVPLWDEAFEVYGSLGANRDLARLAAQLRDHGIKRGTRSRHVRASTGWESLTATEHKVINLVAQRLSNPEVSQRLFISRHTVESHLRTIYRKLGISSRRELAALAATHATGALM